MSEPHGDDTAVSSEGVGRTRNYRGACGIFIFIEDSLHLTGVSAVV